MKFFVCMREEPKYNDHLHTGSISAGCRQAKYSCSVGMPTEEALEQADVVVVMGSREWHSRLKPKQLARPDRRIVVGCMWDYHYVMDPQVFEGCDIILMRQPNVLFDDPRVRFFPYSVDHELLPPKIVPWAHRRHAVFFAGASQPGPYPTRSAALQEVSGYVWTPTLRRYDPYSRYLALASQARFALACKSRYEICPAKITEYAAVGTIPLFDDPTYALNVLPYTRGYQLGSVREALRDVEGLSEVSADLREYVLRHHTHLKRIVQLRAWIEGAPYDALDLDELRA